MKEKGPRVPNGLPNVFATYHPAVAFCYLACVIVLAMAAMQPVCVALALAGALGCSCVARGPRATARSLLWALPMVVLALVLNPFFSASGSTELVRIGSRAIYAESLAYGACSGAMMAAVLLWFASYAACMTSEATLALFGRALPTVSLMVSQVLRLVPQFVTRGRAIRAVQRSISAAAPRDARAAASDRLRTVSVLMGWGMEDGLVRGDAMRARGYGCGARRTSYRRYRLTRADVGVLVVIAMLAIVSALALWQLAARFSFYPRLALDALAPWWAYAPYAALMLVPEVLAAREWWLWRASR